MHFPVLLLAIVSLCSIAATSPLQGRQVAPGNSSIADLIAQCAPYSFDIHQFTTFSGSDTAPPQISFFFTNENDVDVNGAAGNTAVFCSVTLPMYENIMSDYTVWSCQVRFSPYESLCGVTDKNVHPERNRLQIRHQLSPHSFPKHDL
jgi:hypothetical protein